VPGEEDDEQDIRLGDAVISKPTASFGGVVQYDLDKVFDRGRVRTNGSAEQAAGAPAIERGKSGG
jgi:hypothetical protein